MSRQLDPRFTDGGVPDAEDVVDFHWPPRGHLGHDVRDDVDGES